MFVAHRLVLASCSEYFATMLQETPADATVVVLNNVSHATMSRLLDFMYMGQVQVPKDEITSLMSTAECLQVKGLGSGAHQTDPDPMQSSADDLTTRVEPYSKKAKIETPSHPPAAKSPPCYTTTVASSRPRHSTNEHCNLGAQDLSLAAQQTNSTKSLSNSDTTIWPNKSNPSKYISNNHLQQSNHDTNAPSAHRNSTDPSHTNSAQTLDRSLIDSRQLLDNRSHPLENRGRSPCDRGGPTSSGIESQMEQHIRDVARSSQAQAIIDAIHSSNQQRLNASLDTRIHVSVAAAFNNNNSCESTEAGIKRARSCSPSQDYDRTSLKTEVRGGTVLDMCIDKFEFVHLNIQMFVALNVYLHS